MNVVVIGDGNKIIDQYPKANVTIDELDKVFLITNSNDKKMPNLIGYSKSEVLVLEKLLNLNIEYSGDGYVYDQDIKEGTVLKESDTIKLKLKQKK